MSGAPERRGIGRPSRAEIAAQLETLLADKAFAGADRLSRMLRYLVETAVNGAASELKEYTVGIEVFDRDPSYDPRTDSVVRVHGSRLRSKLAEYYASAGANDPVIIDVPKGGYAPVFRYRIEARPEARVIALEPRPSPVPPPKPAGRSWPTIAVAAGVAALLIVAGTMLYLHLTAGPPPAVHRIVRPITSMTGDQRHPSFSPDASQIAFSWQGEIGGPSAVYVTTRDGGPVRRITNDSQPDRNPAWSPDGRHIAFIRGEHTVMVISPLGGLARRIADTDAQFVSWTPDAESVLISKKESSANVLYAVSVTTGGQRPLTSTDENPDDFTPFAVSPDSKYLAYARRGGDRANASLYVRRLSGGAARQLTRGAGEIKGWAWTPDGEIVFAMQAGPGYSLWRARADGGDAVAIADTQGAQYPTVAQAPGPAGPSRELIAWERSNSHVALNETEIRPGAQPANVSGPRPLLSSTQTDSSPQFSPDGKWIVFTSNRGGFNEIWRSDSMGRNAVQLTSLNREQKSPGSPRWSPDSSRIVFDARDASHSNIYVIGSDGGPLRQVTRWPADQIRPRWSRDGKWIYFGSSWPSRWSMWKAPADATDIPPERAQRLTSESGFEPVESADGSLIYFFRPTFGQSIGQLFSVPAAGGPATKVMDDPVNHGWWALGSNGVYFVGAAPGTPAGQLSGKDRRLDYFSFATRRVTELASIPGMLRLYNPDFCLSPDERRIVYGQVDESTNIMIVEPGS
ncbi:MAG TPA: hypothetical protein VFA04_15085 [Bryobacteraceae bacterium]|nr:hypothetical protein [Bryobacteraceae bacterium]